MGVAELSILWPPRLREIETGHDLQSLHDAGVHGQRRGVLLSKDAVYSVSHMELGLVGADMHIASVEASGIGQELIDGGDDRLFAIVSARVDLVP